MKRLHGLECRVDIGEIFGLHEAGLVIDVRFDHTISNSLVFSSQHLVGLKFNFYQKTKSKKSAWSHFSDNEFGVDSRVELELLRNVIQRDFRIRQADHFHARFDHIMSKSLLEFEKLI